MCIICKNASTQWHLLQRLYQLIFSTRIRTLRLLVRVSRGMKLRHSTSGMWAKQIDSWLRTWNQLRTRNRVLSKCIWEWSYKWNQNQLETGPRTRQYPNRNVDISLWFVLKSHDTRHDSQQTYRPKSIVNWLLQGEAGKNWPAYSLTTVMLSVFWYESRSVNGNGAMLCNTTTSGE